MADKIQVKQVYSDISNFRKLTLSHVVLTSTDTPLARQDGVNDDKSVSSFSGHLLLWGNGQCVTRKNFLFVPVIDKFSGIYIYVQYTAPYFNYIYNLTFFFASSDSTVTNVA